jgi:hypothetical protein
VWVRNSTNVSIQSTFNTPRSGVNDGIAVGYDNQVLISEKTAWTFDTDDYFLWNQGNVIGLAYLDGFKSH